MNDKYINNNILRWTLIGCGWLSIVAGVVGIFLPLLPTVPFLLLAAACFARSSQRFHSWLIEHNHLGPLIRDYLNSGCIPARAKRISIGMVWISFPASAFIFAHAWWVKIVLISMAVAVTFYLLSLPTIQPLEKKTESDSAGN